MGARQSGPGQQEFVWQRPTDVCARPQPALDVSLVQQLVVCGDDGQAGDAGVRGQRARRRNALPGAKTAIQNRSPDALVDLGIQRRPGVAVDFQVKSGHVEMYELALSTITTSGLIPPLPSGFNSPLSISVIPETRTANHASGRSFEFGSWHVTGPSGRIQGLNLRLYNPESRQWSLHFANARTGTITEPVVGSFSDGRGAFYGQEIIDGRVVFVRFFITEITLDSIRFEQPVTIDAELSTLERRPLQPGRPASLTS